MTLLCNLYETVETYSVLGTWDTTCDWSQRFPQVSCRYIATMFRFRRFANKIFRIEWNCCRADSSSLVVGSSLCNHRFRKLVGTFTKELTEELILGRFLIFGRSLTFLLLSALFRWFSFSRRCLFLIRFLLFSRYQRFVLENRVESRNDESRSINFLLDDLRFAKLLLSFFTQKKSECLVPLWPRFIFCGSLELFLARYQLYLEKLNLEIISFRWQRILTYALIVWFNRPTFKIKVYMNQALYMNLIKIGNQIEIYFYSFLFLNFLFLS